ncbi:MAG: single-stranded-DNA-specific exonuclease RecJ [Thermodesulfobacteriota bacterium]|nr:single-stranded-DNA-specific exonuclease RecJ [Thermodesulfobacteriota bacterium]
MHTIKKRWYNKEPNKEIQRLLSRELSISPLISQILINRGIEETDSAHRFLYPGLSQLHPPFMMKDIKKALHRLIHAIKTKEKIIIYGDYDVDGITSVAVLLTFLRNLGANASFYIPHRLSEGYGLNANAMESIIRLGAKLLITVDCGINDIEEVSLAQREGLDVIITDHHEVPDILPPACAILNPKQKDCGFPYKSLAGVGIAFNLIIALRTRLREMGFWKHKRIPNLKEYLDLVALGTIADVVPLTDENRIIVKFGLEQLTYSTRPGIIALKEVSELKNTIITPWMVGYRLAPRLNAAGRLSRADEGVRLLTTQDLKEAEGIARVLDIENTKRQQIEDQILKDAKEMIKKDESLLLKRTITLASCNWHPGIMGIVASRLVEEYYKPTVMISLDNAVGKGSARSIEGFHLYEGIRECAHLLKAFGGHKYAAGLTIDEKNIPAFRDLFEKIVKNTLSEDDFTPKISIDAEITIKELTEGLLEELEILAPFGPSNPEPTFSSSLLYVLNSNIVGNEHLKLRLKQDGCVCDAIGFYMGKNTVLPRQYIKAAFSSQINNWQGIKTIQMKLKDIHIVD